MSEILDPLWNWFRDQAIPFFDKLGRRIVQEIFLYAESLIRSAKAFWVFLCAVWAVTVWAVTQIRDSFANIDLHQLEAPLATQLEYFLFINRFIPVVEAFAGALLCFELWLLVVIIRWVKSFIPTLSN